MDETPDFSKALENLQQMLSSDDGQNRLQNLLGMFSASADESAPETFSPQNDSLPQSLSSFAEGIDFDTMLKVAGILQTMSSEQGNPKFACLSSLRPFLRESRQKSLDKAASLLKLSSILKAFRQGGA